MALATLVAALGLASRRFAAMLPGVVAAYAGDTLWALGAYLGILILRPTIAVYTAAPLALGVSVLVEISQLYHAPWIDWVRSQPIGGLILGFGFLWSDLACYTVGVSFGAIVDGLARSSKSRGVPPTRAAPG